jgi:hypothetical protein
VGGPRRGEREAREPDDGAHPLRDSPRPPRTPRQHPTHKFAGALRCPSSRVRAKAKLVLAPHAAVKGHAALYVRVPREHYGARGVQHANLNTLFEPGRGEKEGEVRAAVPGAGRGGSDG